MSKKLSPAKQAKGLAIVAAYLGPKMGYEGPAPTGDEAAAMALGPVLVPAWNWPIEPTPTVILEGGPYDWAIEIGEDETAAAAFAKAGIFAEPYAGYALCLYPA